MATRSDRDKPHRLHVTLVPMEARHIPEIMAIETGSFADPWERVSFERELGNPYSHPVVALDADGRVAGYVIYWATGPEYHILNIAVRPDVRRMGVGVRLMNKVITEAGRQNADFIVLEVRPSNVPARSLYLKYGFVTVGFRSRYYKDGESAEVMLLRLRH